VLSMLLRELSKAFENPRCACVCVCVCVCVRDAHVRALTQAQASGLKSDLYSDCIVTLYSDCIVTVVNLLKR